MTPPTSFQQLPVAPPDFLAAAFGYAGDDRWIAFYWERAGDELAWTTPSRHTRGADASTWRLFIEHPAIHQHLAAFGFGDSDHLPRHWLLLDRLERAIYAGPADEVRTFLRGERPQEPESEPLAPFMLSDTHVLSIVNSRREVQSPSPEGIQKHIEERRLRYLALESWLDSLRTS